MFADNGIEGVKVFLQNNYDIIFMDCQMPIMNGYEAASEIRKIEKDTGRHTPIVAMTAYAMFGDKEKCIAAGMDEYISKPAEPEKIMKMIEKYRPC